MAEDQKFNNFNEERRAGWSDLSYDIQYIKRDISEIKQTIKDGKIDNVTQLEFRGYKEVTDNRLKIVERITYGLIGIVLTTVLVAGLTFVIISRHS